MAAFYPEQFTGEELENTKKFVTITYIKGKDIFQGIEPIKLIDLDDTDKKKLGEGVYKVASEGKIIQEAVTYVNKESEIQSKPATLDTDGSASVESNVLEEPVVDEEQVFEEQVFEELGDGKPVNVETINEILEKVVAHLDVDGNITDNEIKNIKGDDNADANAVIAVLNKKLNEDPQQDIKELINKAITATGVEGYTIPDDKSASDIAVELVKAASASASDSVKEVENADAVTGTNPADNTDKAAVIKLLNDAKTAFDGKIDDKTVTSLVEYLNTEYPTKENDNTPNIETVINNAIAEVESYNFGENPDHSQIALELLKKAKSASSEVQELNDNEANTANTEGQGGPEVPGQGDNANANPPDVTVDNVTALLETQGLVTAEGEGKEKTYTIKDKGGDDDVLGPIIAALKAKAAGSKLDQVLKNAIAAAKIPEDNKKSAAQIAADLIENADDEEPTGLSTGGSKPNKYVYGGKTLRAYPKNISFSKKNPAKKRQNKKTIRKLQKLLNKLK